MVKIALPSRRVRSLAACCAAALATLLGPAHAARAATPVPPQGVYEECGAIYGEQTCLDRLQQIHDGGFSLVVNYTQWYGDAASVLDYAERARELGIKVIWPLNDAAWRDGEDLRAHYPYLAADCGCTDNEGFKRYVIGLVKDLPATWGYYVGDEVPAAQHAAAKAWSDEIKTLDPAHPTLIVSLENGATAGGNLRPFADTADVLAGDVYPVGMNGPLADVSTVADGVRKIAASAGKASAMVLQAFDWNEYPDTPGTLLPRWPSREEMQTMRDLAVGHAQPSMVLWYSYYDVERSDDPAAHWRDLTSAASAPLPAAAHVMRRAGHVSRRAALRRALTRCIPHRTRARRIACRVAVRQRFNRREARRAS